MTRKAPARPLPDRIAPGLRLLMCGLNPSLHAVEAGLGYVTPGNRFWPAMLEAGLVTRDRDWEHALTVHRIGMTDLVARATPRAAEVSRDEFRAGLAELEAKCERYQPGAVCFVGLVGWRAAVDRKAVAGPQERTVGGRPAYVMPSTSGLNASSQIDTLVDHMRDSLRFCSS